MKRFVSFLLAVVVLLGCLMVTACNNEDNTGDSTKQGQTGNDKHSGYIKNFKGDWITLNEGADAHDHWHADKYYYDISFDENGKCTGYLTHYNFPDPSLYEDANDTLESGNWKPTWNDAHTEFITKRNSISYIEIEDAYDAFDSKYFAYTITWSDNSTQRVEVPSQAQKDQDLLTNLGITRDILSQAPGSDLQIMHQYKTQIFAYLKTSDPSIETINAYGEALYNAIKAVADDGIMYDYIEYKPVTECPQVTSIYESVMFMYKVNGVKINVSASISDGKIALPFPRHSDFLQESLKPRRLLPSKQPSFLLFVFRSISRNVFEIA